MDNANNQGDTTMKTATFSDGSSEIYNGKRNVSAAYLVVDYNGRSYGISFSRDTVTAEKSAKSWIGELAKNSAMNSGRWDGSTKGRRRFGRTSISPANKALIEEFRSKFTYEVVTI
jgi:hypothetical protein